MTERQDVIWFNDFYTSALGHRLGGKGASLVGLMAGGLPVPHGFVVSTDAYAAAMSESDLPARIDARLASVHTSDLDDLAAAGAEIRGWFETLKLPNGVAASVEEAYWRLQGDGQEPPVAVRSSASAEDLPDASFAGALDTHLWVSGIEEVILQIERCWGSLFTDRAIAYRLDHHTPAMAMAMAVVVQQMVDPVSSGVAFTLNPSNGDRSQIVIDAAWGNGEGVVSGLVTPDHFRVDKVVGEVIEAVISSKEVEIVRNPSGQGCLTRPLSHERANQACLTQSELQAVSDIARRCEQVFGRPQDIEWVLEQGEPGTRRVMLLQSRPETVWSRRPRRQVTPPDTPTGALYGVLDALMAATRPAAQKDQP